MKAFTGRRDVVNPEKPIGTVSTEEKATAAQIHNYLKQAQQALDNGDTDGAHLLATKAKVLLDELTKP